eukprot:7146324-Prymnesium_polylepis.1
MWWVATLAMGNAAAVRLVVARAVSWEVMVSALDRTVAVMAAQPQRRHRASLARLVSCSVKTRAASLSCASASLRTAANFRSSVVAGGSFADQPRQRRGAKWRFESMRQPLDGPHVSSR